MKYLTFIAALTLPNFATAQDWPTTIAKVETRLDALYETGAEFGMPLPGNHSAEAIGRTHRCAILGRTFDEVAAIAPLEQLTVPPLTATSSEENKWAYAEALKSLDIWLHMAKQVTRQPRASQALLWNELCVGKTFYAEDGAPVTIPANLRKPEVN